MLLVLADPFCMAALTKQSCWSAYDWLLHRFDQTATVRVIVWRNNPVENSTTERLDSNDKYIAFLGGIQYLRVNRIIGFPALLYPFSALFLLHVTISMDLDVFFILDALIVLRFYCYLNAIGDRPFRFAYNRRSVPCFCRIFTNL